MFHIQPTRAGAIRSERHRRRVGVSVATLFCSQNRTREQISSHWFAKRCDMRAVTFGSLAQKYIGTYWFAENGE